MSSCTLSLMYVGSPAPKLKHLTKDRVSQKPSKRPPSRKKAGINRTASYEGTSPASRYVVEVPDYEARSSTLNSHWDNDDDEDIMFMESTV